MSRIALSSAPTKKASPSTCIDPAAAALRSSSWIAAATSGPALSIANTPVATAPTSATFANIREPPSAAASLFQSTTANTRNARQPTMKIQLPLRILFAFSW